MKHELGKGLGLVKEIEEIKERFQATFVAAIRKYVAEGSVYVRYKTDVMACDWQGENPPIRYHTIRHPTYVRTEVQVLLQDKPLRVGIVKRVQELAAYAILNDRKSCSIIRISASRR